MMSLIPLIMEMNEVFLMRFLSFIKRKIKLTIDIMFMPFHLYMWRENQIQLSWIEFNTRLFTYKWKNSYLTLVVWVQYLPFYMSGRTHRTLYILFMTLFFTCPLSKQTCPPSKQKCYSYNLFVPLFVLSL